MVGLAGEAIIFAILAGLLFAIANMFMRVGVIKGDPVYGTAVSTLTGSMILGITLVMLNQITAVLTLDVFDLVLFAVAGLLNFTVSRTLFFVSSSIIGVARAQPIISLNAIVAVVVGLTFLAEKLTLSEGLSVIFMLSGLILISLSNPEKRRLSQSKFSAGLLYALIGSIAVGFSPILIAIGFRSGAQPIVGISISYFFASLGWGLVLLFGRWLRFPGEGRKVIRPFVIQGFFVTLAQLNRYFSIYVGPVVLVTPIFTSVSPILTALFAYIFLQRIEQVNFRVWLSIAFVVLGIYLAST
ncbi:MAG: EamA family transporter [Nitrososphaerales archaeon]